MKYELSFCACFFIDNTSNAIDEIGFSWNYYIWQQVNFMSCFPLKTNEITKTNTKKYPK